VVEALPEPERGAWAEKLVRVLARDQNGSGSWWDFPFYGYHEAYGTSFALRALESCRRILAKARADGANAGSE
jgi:hypothetical protein